MKGAFGPVERILARDTWIVSCAVVIVVVLAGLYTALGIGMPRSALDMTRMSGAPMEMVPAAAWTWEYAFLIFLMWWVMMIAMMTPSATPVLLLFTALKRHGSQTQQATRLCLTFLAGYLLAWMSFSAAAALVQWLATYAGIVNGAMMALGSGPAAGAVLLVAGAYQFSGLKAACLRHCRSPAQFLTAHARKGYSGALSMGLRHGGYCMGCCWALMALLFAGGMMNLYWIVGLAIYVLLEKTLPARLQFTRAAGAVLIAAGLWLALSGLGQTGGAVNP